MPPRFAVATPSTTSRVAEAAGPRLRGRDQVAAADEVARDIDNFRAVLDWAAETPSVDHALRLVAAARGERHDDRVRRVGLGRHRRRDPGASEHPLFPVVASWAVMGAAFGGDLERAATLVARVEAAEATLGSRQPAACQGTGSPGVLPRRSRGRAPPRGEVGRPGPGGRRPYELAHALIMYGAAMQFTDGDRVHDARGGRAIARDAGIASALSIGLPALAGPDPARRVRRAVALLDEAIDVGTSIGDRLAVSSNACNQRRHSPAGSGEWRSALAGERRHVRAQVSVGTVVAVPVGASLARGRGIVGLGHPETAAVLVGAADAQGNRSRAARSRTGESRWRRRPTPPCSQALGEGATRRARDRGQPPRARRHGRYLRAEADRVLGDEPVP